MNNVNVLNNTIEDISVNDTQKKLDELKRSITNLSDTEKLEKKSEIEYTISKIKLELVELKKDSSIDTAQIQNIEQQLSIIETDYNTFLNNIQNELSTLEQNIQDNEEEKDSSRWERNKKNVLIGGGVLGAGLLIRRWWKKRKERKSGGSNSSNNTERKPWYKKRWGIGLIGVGGVLAWKNRDAIKDKFNDVWNWITGQKNPETAPGDSTVATGSFEKLSAAEQEKYLKFSDDMSSFGTSYPGYFNVSLSDDADKDKKLKGTMIHTLDKNIGNLSNFGNEEMIDFMQKQSTDDFLDKVGNWAKGKAYSYLGPYLQSIESFQPFGQKFISDPAGAIREWLQGGENREEQLQNFLKYNLNIFNYVTEKRIILKERLAKEQVMGKARLNEEPNESEQDQIDDLLSDDAWEKSQFIPLLSKYNLANLPTLLNEYTIEVADISQESEELNDLFQEDREEAFSIDEDGETCISRARTDLLDGSLEEESKEELIELCEWLLDDISGSGNSSNRNFLDAYTHLITDIFGGSEDSAKQLIDTLKLGELDENIKNTLYTFVNKLENNNFSTTDLDDLEQKANGYFNLKESTEKTIQNAEQYNSGGLSFDWKKALMLPINAIKDVGKLFDGDSSRRERIGSGLGGLYISGQTLYIYSKTGLVGSTVAEFAGKGAIKIGQLPVTIGQEAIKLATGRRFLTGHAWFNYINSPTLTFDEKKRMLRYAFLRGEVSDRTAKKIAEAIGSQTINNKIESVLNFIGIKNPAHQKVYLEYRKNKNMRDLLFTSNRLEGQQTKTRFKYNVTKRTLARDMVPNMDAFKKLTSIHNKIEGLGGDSKLFRNQFMKTTKTLDKIDDVLANNNTRQLVESLGKNSSNISRYARVLGKNFNKFNSADDFHKYLEFLNRQKSVITDFDAFVANTVGKGEDIIKMSAAEQTTFAKSPKLNQSFVSKRINWMKDNFRKTSETLKKLAPKSPYLKNILSQSKNLETLSKVDDETFKAMQGMDSGLRNQKRFINLSSQKGFLTEVSSLIKSNKEFAKAISKAKTPKAVREVFASFNQKVPKEIPDEFFGKLASTKSTKKIFDTVNYIEKYESLNKVTKILQSPGMKYAGRILGRTLGVGTVVLGGFIAHNTYQEGSEISRTNKERGGLKQQEAYFDAALAVAGACAFVPGVGRIAGGTILGVTVVGGYLKESVYGTLDKFTKNYKDFLSDSPLLIKQHIITTSLGQQGVDRSFSESIGRAFSSKDFEHLTRKTGSEAMKGLLYVDEWKEDPLAMINIQDSELMNKLANENPPITYDMVAQAVKQVEDNINKRYEFLKTNLGTVEIKDDTGNTIQVLDTSKYITPSKISGGSGMLAIDQLMMLSKYNMQDPNKFANIDALKGNAEGLGSTLKNDADSFSKLESLFEKDKRTLCYMYRHATTLEQHIDQFAVDDNGNNTEAEKDKIIKNKDYLNDYMIYKSLITGIDLSSLVYPDNGIPNLISVREFLLDFKNEKPLSSTEVLLSTNKLQNTLYRIAVEVLGVQDIKNTPEDLLSVFNEAHEKAYGIYFKKGDINRLCVNGNYLSDSEYTLTDGDLSKFKNDISEKINSEDLIDIGTGDEILNKEVGNRYMKIIQEEINRA